jgi:3-keto steroid reductase
VHHNISSWNGAAAIVHVCLAPLAFIPIFLSAVGAPAAKDKGQEEGVLPVCLHSVTDRMGRGDVALAPFYEWPQYEKEAARLVDRCERLYQSFIVAGGKPQQ